MTSIYYCWLVINLVNWCNLHQRQKALIKNLQLWLKVWPKTILINLAYMYTYSVRITYYIAHGELTWMYTFCVLTAWYTVSLWHTASHSKINTQNWSWDPECDTLTLDIPLALLLTFCALIVWCVTATHWRMQWRSLKGGRGGTCPPPLHLGFYQIECPFKTTERALIIVKVPLMY